MQNEKEPEDYSDLNGLTLAPQRMEGIHSGKMERISTMATEKDIEHGVHMDRIETNVTLASMVELPETEDKDFYDSIPDGGYGWVIAVCGFLVNFIMFGTSAIWGVFSNAYATTVLAGKASTMQLMGVGSLMIVTLNLFSPIGPLLSPLGPRLVLFAGAVMMSLGIILAGFSTEVWHLYLTMGLVFGVGSSLVYMSIVSVIPQWFTTRRGTAMGLSSAGSGFGGLALSPMVTSLVAKFGLPWAHRIIGLMAFGICATAACFLRTRLPPQTKKQPVKLPIKLSMLKDVNFLLMLAGLVIALFGYLIPLFYLPTYARAFGVTASESSNLVGVACAMNAIGRLSLGFVGDRIGRINMFAIASTSSGLFCMLLWPFAKTYQTMMAFAVLFGFTCGIYYALAPPITASVVGTENIASGLSLLFIMSSIAGVGPPIASAIQLATPNNGFIGIQMFSGAVYITGSAICMYLKLRLTGSLFSVM
ncbi:major facilitator superfamily domain-containing protein [Sporodiniella umbellata]|nr:major facilitator superfamily domain-containing protein [Sporodiniella umbellata]